ncbi:winged helix-turn-helix domain-containing protein [Tenacibaculum retecalamus]|uniref:winged helix-turn-helix domain-containing protein n=1 Tax=Tenacibaculum retecalamus TaxID=3018315 RepID=UPI0023D8E2CB|nr:winged helix-turn-helix domain-containing protein [Tenacibaculum retecalamus]WBX71860.1 winged helix-turn-helix domain-containing protein [Tenacibaculum retecalamus]
MSRNKIYIYSVLVLLLFLSWIFSPSSKKNEDFSERVKVSLRDVGNQLLLSNKDATSLILPVTKFDGFTYKISFQNQLSFEPSNLVAIVDSSFKKAALSNYYRVEVLQCSDNEVAYSFEIKNKIEKDIVPCKGRILPKSCYIIKLKFTNRTIVPFNKNLFLIVFVLLLVVFLFDYKLSKKKIKELPTDDKNEATKIGSFQFYPEQNKLVKQATEINLSKKECELLAIFVASPNQIIKRDELTKKVWEDNGVFVGRSLDTYISKLRKKLKEDSSVKLTNIHGVGYKLELN